MYIYIFKFDDHIKNLIDVDLKISINKHNKPIHTRWFPASTKHFLNIYTMLDQRRRRWAGVV